MEKQKKKLAMIHKIKTRLEELQVKVNHNQIMNRNEELENYLECDYYGLSFEIYIGQEENIMLWVPVQYKNNLQMIVEAISHLYQENVLASYIKEYDDLPVPLTINEWNRNIEKRIRELESDQKEEAITDLIFFPNLKERKYS